MTTRIDAEQAEAAARAAFTAWGVVAPGAIRVAECPGGWRCSIAPDRDGRAPSTVGSSVAVVRAVDGNVFRVPAGATDDTIAELLQAG